MVNKCSIMSLRQADLYQVRWPDWVWRDRPVEGENVPASTPPSFHTLTEQSEVG